MELTWDLYNPSSDADRILVLTPSLGGNCAHQWAKVADLLSDRARVVFVDYPGHALSQVWDDADEPRLEVIADAVVDVISRVREQVGDLPVVYAGLSIGGATGLHLARDHADAVAGVAVVASGATVGESSRWLARAERVEAEGTQHLIDETVQRWFTPTFRATHTGVVATIMEGLADADDHSYAQLCRCLAVHDVRDDLADIRCPLLIVAGERDSSTPMVNQEFVAETVPGARFVVVPDASHQIPVAAPREVADALGAFLDRVGRPRRGEADD
ncbi:MAG: alpha/beta fold hydrolase [Arachnia propionica]|uniref:alpha/beta fold hydrolase n=1 Tax=Arachnia propionica TaxID=1750 RepID=UPI00271178D2|nr:alpha/beta fold hydrolase [Arachnia propionica]